MRRSLIVAFLLAMSFETNLGGAADSIKALIAGYRNWKPTTTEPVLIPMQVSTLCRAPTPEEQTRTPHEGRYVFVYVNPTGREAYDRKASFPDGTVIVKEKRLKPDDETTIELGVMTKHGTSWEFSFIDASGRSAGGEKLFHCAKCHSRAANDSVFGRPAQHAPATTGKPKF